MLVQKLSQDSRLQIKVRNFVGRNFPNPLIIESKLREYLESQPDSCKSLPYSSATPPFEINPTVKMTQDDFKRLYLEARHCKLDVSCEVAVMAQVEADLKAWLSEVRYVMGWMD